MSFSFAARGKTRLLLLADIAANMARVVESQPVHAADQPLVVQTSELYANAVAEPKENEVLTASVNGSVSVANYGTPEAQVRHVSLGVSIGCQFDTSADRPAIAHTGTAA